MTASLYSNSKSCKYPPLNFIFKSKKLYFPQKIINLLTKFNPFLQKHFFFSQMLLSKNPII